MDRLMEIIDTPMTPVEAHAAILLWVSETVIGEDEAADIQPMGVFGEYEIDDTADRNALRAEQRQRLDTGPVEQPHFRA